VTAVPVPGAAVDLYERVHATAAAIRARCPTAPQVGLILGSGLGGFADGFAHPTAIDHGDLAGFPRSRVAGHSGLVALGELAP
jgi:purine-nucleoside phosphorylase